MNKVNSKKTLVLNGIFGTSKDYSVPQVEDITPKIARALLGLNTNNRNIRLSHVKWLAAQMKHGYWLFTGEPIRVSYDEVLLDKQHTLLSVIESQTTIKMVVLGGLQPEVFEVLDSGLKRQANDVLHMAGIPDAFNVAAIARKVMSFRNRYYNAFGSRSHGKNEDTEEDRELITNATILEMVMEDQSLFHHVNKMGRQFYSGMPAVSQSFWGAMYYLFREKDTDAAYDFCHRVSAMDNVSVGTPEHTLAKRLQAELNSRANHPGRTRIYWFLNCWNKYRRGDSLHVLKNPSPKKPLPAMI